MTSIKYQWRVTKYNPDYRDEFGHYTLREDWTSPYDIGNVFIKKEFTLKEYLQVESSYINAVITFLEECGIEFLRVLHLEERDLTEEDKSSFLFESEYENVVIQEDKLLNKEEIQLICRMVLRDFLHCHFYFNDVFFVHFGWDYYMYIGSNVHCSEAIKEVTKSGLFVEPMQSAYYIAEDEITRSVAWSDISDESKIVVGEEVLKGIHLDEFRKIFHLSSKHPVTGSFEITEKHIDFFQKHMIHQINLDEYEYSFWSSS